MICSNAWQEHCGSQTWGLCWKSWSCLELLSIAEAMKKAVPEWIHDQHIYTQPRFMRIGHFAMLCFTEIKMLLPECCWLYQNLLQVLPVRQSKAEKSYADDFQEFRCFLKSLWQQATKDELRLKTRVDLASKVFSLTREIHVYLLHTNFCTYCLLTSVKALTHIHTHIGAVSTCWLQMCKYTGPFNPYIVTINAKRSGQQRC